MRFQEAFVVHDSWKDSSAANEALCFKSAPPVNHSIGWRDSATGFHSNDIESEFARLKSMVRERYGRVSFQSTLETDEAETENASVDLGDLYEYAFRVNIGSSFHHVLKSASAGFTCLAERCC